MNIETKLHELRQAGAERARARAYFSSLDRLRKQVKAAIQHKLITEGMTIGKAECAALTHEEYTQAALDAEAAEHDALLADANYHACQMEIEVFRTLEASKRAEMRLV